MPARRLLVATDFSDASRIAFGRAAALAAARSAELIVVHVFDPTRYQSFVGRELAPDALAEERNAVQLALDSTCDARPRTIPVLIDGYPDEQIVEAARAWSADLIVIGAHGRGEMERALVGSVADRVVRTTETPVLIARGRTAEAFERILVATEFGPQAERALELAIVLAAPRAVIDVVHVLDVPGAGGDLPLVLDPAVLRAAEADARRRGAEAVAPHRHAGLDVRFDCEVGSARTAILRRAEACDLIALGSRGRRGLKRFLLGSVAETVMRRASASVLVTK